MDPNSNLAEQLRLCQRLDDRSGACGVCKGNVPEAEPCTQSHIAGSLEDAARLAELVLALNEWIMRGGFLPVPWQKKGKTK